MRENNAGHLERETNESNIEFIIMAGRICKGEEQEHNLVKRKSRCYNKKQFGYIYDIMCTERAHSEDIGRET